MIKGITIDCRKKSGEPYLVYCLGELSDPTVCSPMQWEKSGALDITSERMKMDVAKIAFAEFRKKTPFNKLVSMKRPEIISDALAWLELNGMTYHGTKKEYVPPVTDPARE